VNTNVKHICPLPQLIVGSHTKTTGFGRWKKTYTYKVWDSGHYMFLCDCGSSWEYSAVKLNVVQGVWRCIWRADEGL
jgi:hypothetical protein